MQKYNSDKEEAQRIEREEFNLLISKFKKEADWLYQELLKKGKGAQGEKKSN